MKKIYQSPVTKEVKVEQRLLQTASLDPNQHITSSSEFGSRRGGWFDDDDDDY